MKIDIRKKETCNMKIKYILGISIGGNLTQRISYEDDRRAGNPNPEQ